MKKTFALIALAAAFVAGGTWFLTRPVQTDPLLGAALAQEAEVDTSQIAEMTRGDADAPVTVVEYASFTCPHCATFHDEVLPELQSEYVDTGKVQLVYREVYFDRYGLWASMVARCGGEERFFGIADLIYERQRDWAQGDPAEIAESLRRIGKTAGLTDERLDECLTDADKAQSLVAWYEANAEADDITSTPSFLIDGEKFEGNWSTELLPAIDAALEE